MVNYKMGIRVNGTPLPDPTSWKYQVADLDTEGSRDATGYLHRNRVASKMNYEFEWKALKWELLDNILKAVDEDKFNLVAPDPRNFRRQYSGDYYVGDRSGENHYYLVERPEIGLYSLKLKFIEY